MPRILSLIWFFINDNVHIYKIDFNWIPYEILMFYISVIFEGTQITHPTFFIIIIILFIQYLLNFFSWKVPDESCISTPRQQCSTVPRQQCSTVPRQQCRTVPNQQCSPVSRQECTSVPREQCQQVPQKQCSTVPQQQCRLNTYI